MLTTWWQWIVFILVSGFAAVFGAVMCGVIYPAVAELLGVKLAGNDPRINLNPYNGRIFNEAQRLRLLPLWLRRVLLVLSPVVLTLLFVIELVAGIVGFLRYISGYYAEHPDHQEWYLRRLRARFGLPESVSFIKR